MKSIFITIVFISIILLSYQKESQSADLDNICKNIQNSYECAQAMLIEWLYEPKEYALFSFIEWIDNNTIKLEKYTRIAGGYMHIPQLLKKDKLDNWELFDYKKNK